MATDYNKRQADWAKKEQLKEDEERKGEVKIGEAIGKVTEDIGKSSETRIRIDNVETLRFEPSVDLTKGDSIKITVKADWTGRGQEKQKWGHEREFQAGEAFGRVTGNIKKSHDLRVKIDNVEMLGFEPSADLKKGDSIRITIEKV